MRRWAIRSKSNRIWRIYRVASLLLRTLYFINRERTRVVRAHARGEYDVQPDTATLVRIVREFRQAATDLGGLLIKLGQFLGTRADMLPPEALIELAALHDDVPPESFADIKAAVERELEKPLGEVFSAFDTEPAGSASLGQVHWARLHDGRRAAVKVRRPGIAGIVRTDLNTLHFVLRVVRWVAPAADRLMDLRALYREFSRTVYEELDYQDEGLNAERFARVFADDDRVVVPAVIWEYSTREVLTLEWVGGIKITDCDALDDAGVDRDALAVQLAGTYFKQVFTAGFFHADPHPGNIFVQPTPKGPRLAFVDFGMMGVMTPRMKTGLRDCFGGILHQDATIFVEGLDSLGFLGQDADHAAIEQAVGILLTRFTNMPLQQIRTVLPREMLSDVAAVLYDQPLRLPSQLAFFGRALGMLMGVSLTLSPDFNFAKAAVPYAREFMSQGGLSGLLGLLGVDSLNALGRNVVHDSITMIRAIANLPPRLERLLVRAERGEMRIIIEGPLAVERTATHPKRSLLQSALRVPIPAWVPIGALAAFTITQFLRRKPR